MFESTLLLDYFQAIFNNVRQLPFFLKAVASIKLDIYLNLLYQIIKLFKKRICTKRGRWVTDYKYGCQNLSCWSYLKK